MMDALGYLLSMAAGLVFGGVVVWLLVRAKMAQAGAEAANSTVGEMATLSERCVASDKETAELRSRLNAELSRAQSLQAQLADEKAAHAATGEKAARANQTESNLNATRGENTALKERLAALQKQAEGERRAAQEKLALIDDARVKLSDAFKALSAEALRQNNQSFLDLANAALATFQEGARGDLDKRQQAITELVKPVRETLASFDAKVQKIETDRAKTYAELTEQVRQLSTGQSQLQTETANLVRALRRPNVRGRWGEIQLQRTVELAGMVEHCDFVQQKSCSTDDGRLRPDMIVHLPNHRDIVIDSKVPLEAYLAAIEATDDAIRMQKLDEHARQVRSHLEKLGAKSYAGQFDNAPDFVVLFLPGESFFSAALDRDPALIDFGVGRNVILATPTTLIALLKAVAYGWKQEQIAEQAQEISNLGAELYERVCKMTVHLERLGKNLGSAVQAYNSAIGNLESRVLPGARRFRELGIAGKDEIESLDQVDHTPRILSAPDWERPEPGAGDARHESGGE